MQRDGSLAALLHEAFKLLEMRFGLYDSDAAGEEFGNRCMRTLSDVTTHACPRA